MSATLEPFATLGELSELKTKLFPQHLTEQELNTGQNLDDKWTWEEGTDTIPIKDESNEWLEECCLTLSPMGDVLVMGSECFLCIFHLMRNLSDDGGALGNSFELVHEKSLPGRFQNFVVIELITVRFPYRSAATRKYYFARSTPNSVHQENGHESSGLDGNFGWFQHRLLQDLHGKW